MEMHSERWNNASAKSRLPIFEGEKGLFTYKKWYKVDCFHLWGCNFFVMTMGEMIMLLVAFVHSHKLGWTQKDTMGSCVCIN